MDGREVFWIQIAACSLYVGLSNNYCVGRSNLMCRPQVPYVTQSVDLK